MKHLLVAAMLAAATGSVSAYAMSPAELPVLFSGYVMAENGPVEGMMVQVFHEKYGPPPLFARYWRVPDIIGHTDGDGRFSVKVPPGMFFAVAVGKAAQGIQGLPRPGDSLYFAPDLAGNPVGYVARPAIGVDAGVISHRVIFEKSTIRFDGLDITSISGKVTGPDGKPVEGVSVFACTAPGEGVEPVFASEPTSTDGRYVLRVSQGGMYYLSVSEHTRAVCGRSATQVLVAGGEIKGNADLRMTATAKEK